MQSDFEIEFEEKATWASDYFNNFLPVPGDLVSVHGRPIVDCAHCPFNGEIHPPIDGRVARGSHLSVRPGTSYSFLTRNTRRLCVVEWLSTEWHNRRSRAASGGVPVRLSETVSRRHYNGNYDGDELLQ